MRIDGNLPDDKINPLDSPVCNGIVISGLLMTINELFSCFILHIQSLCSSFVIPPPFFSPAFNLSMLILWSSAYEFTGGFHWEPYLLVVLLIIAIDFANLRSETFTKWKNILFFSEIHSSNNVCKKNYVPTSRKHHNECNRKTKFFSIKIHSGKLNVNIDSTYFEIMSLKKLVL